MNQNIYYRNYMQGYDSNHNTFYIESLKDDLHKMRNFENEEKIMKRVRSLNDQLNTARKSRLSLKETIIKATDSLRPDIKRDIVRVIQTKRGPKVVRESSLALSNRTLETGPYTDLIRQPKPKTHRTTIQNS